MDPRQRPRAGSLRFKADDFDNDGQLKGTGKINHPGNVRFPDHLGDIQVQEIIAGGDVTVGPGTNLFLRESIYSGGEINAKGSMDSEGSIIAKYGLFVSGDLKAWDEIKASSIHAYKSLLSFGSVFSKYEIIVNGDIKVSEELSSGSNISIKGKSTIGGDMRLMGRFKAKSHVKCSGKITARELYVKGNLFAELGVEILENVKVFGNMKVSGNIKIPVKLEVHGDLEHIGYLECPVVVINGNIYLIHP